MPVAKSAESPADQELTVMSEAEFALLREEEGARVVECDGRYWEVPFPGFYQPIHLLARFKADAFKRPTPFCWGYRAALLDEDAHLANGSVPVHLLANVDQFNEKNLIDCRRKDLRKSRRQVEFRRERDPSLLLEQGWDVFNSAQLRVPHGRPLTRDEYRLRIEQRVTDPRRIFIIGLVEGKLAGYLENFAVDGTIYTHELYVDTDQVRTGIGTGLYIEVIEMGTRSGIIRQVCYGHHCPERQGITTYKNTIGSVVQVPARVYMPALARTFMKMVRPHTHYRLTGMKPAPGVTNDLTLQA
jgi:hypothetical protein